MLRFSVIAAGGAIGSLLRYFVGHIDYRFSYGVFPISTLLINVTGSFLIGLLWAVTDRFTVSPNIRSFLFVGILGGFTTFSTFSLECFNLIRDGEYRLVLMNIFLSNFLAIGFVFVGFFFSQVIFRFID